MATDQLEIRTAISPLDFFFNRIHFIALSIRSLGGICATAPIRVAVGADEQPHDLHARLPWSRPLGIEWGWIDRSDFVAWKDSANPYLATIAARFMPPFTARHVLVLDPDVIPIAPFNDLVAKIESSPAVLGVIAHHSPFWSKDPGSHRRIWNLLYSAAGLGEPRFELQHSAWGIYDQVEERRLSPPYFNSGMILAPSDMLTPLWPHYVEGLRVIAESLNTYFYDQIGFTLALAKSGVPYRSLPLRFNFPNEPVFDVKLAQELSDVRFLHVMRTEIVHRDESFKTLDTVAHLVSRKDLTGSNEAFRRKIAQLLPLALASRPDERNPV